MITNMFTHKIIMLTNIFTHEIIVLTNIILPKKNNYIDGVKNKKNFEVVKKASDQS